MLNHVRRALTLALLALGSSCLYADQLTPIVHVNCAGQGFEHFDVEPFHGNVDELDGVELEIVSTISLARYSGENLVDCPMQFDASSCWLLSVKHAPELGGFAYPQYIYANCGGITLPAFDGADDMHGASFGSFTVGNPDWPPIVNPDYTHDWAHWTEANAPNGLHRLYIKSWSSAQWSAGNWDTSWSLRVRYGMRVHYYTAGGAP